MFILPRGVNRATVRQAIAQLSAEESTADLRFLITLLTFAPETPGMVDPSLLLTRVRTHNMRLGRTAVRQKREAAEHWPRRDTPLT